MLWMSTGLMKALREETVASWFTYFLWCVSSNLIFPVWDVIYSVVFEELLLKLLYYVFSLKFWNGAVAMKSSLSISGSVPYPGACDRLEESAEGVFNMSFWSGTWLISQNLSSNAIYISCFSSSPIQVDTFHACVTWTLQQMVPLQLPQLHRLWQ